MRFYYDKFGASASESADPNYNALGSMLTSDVQSDAVTCLDTLAWIEDVWHGPDEQNWWSGNSWHAVVDKEGLHLTDLCSDDWTGDYEFDEAHEIILAYLAFLRPSSRVLQPAVNTWERAQGRPHPCQGHLE